VSKTNKPSPPLGRLRYWPSWLGVFVLWCCAKLPYTWQYRLGGALGRFAGKVLTSRRKIACINIRKCFPELSADQIEHMTLQSFVWLGRGVFSAALSWWGKPKRLRKLIGNVTGLEQLEAAFARGKGVILLSAHFSADEIGAHLLSLLLQKKLNVMHRQQSSIVFEHVLQQKRLAYMNEVIIRDNIRAMIKCLKQNQGVYYLPDQNFEKEHSIFVPFMGVNTLTLTATARFAKINDCSVVPAFCYQTAKGFDIEILPALNDYPTGDDRADATRINQIFETAIRKHPEQYMWLHRRFKIRPEGEKSFYD